MNSKIFEDTDVIYTYTRKQAIEDGYQVEVTGDVTKQFLKYRVFMTEGVFETIQRAVNNEKYCNDFDGILHDIVWMAYLKIKMMADRGTDTVYFKVIITGAGRKKYYNMVLQIGATDIDDPTPAFTIMFPEDM